MEESSVVPYSERRAWQETFKQSILDTCDKRRDEITSQVRVCVEGAVSDLHAADARYHTIWLPQHATIGRR